MALRSWDDFYNIAKTEIQTKLESLTDFSEGSVLDSVLGAITSAINEVQDTMLDEFKKTFFKSAHGPAVTGGADDLENLAVDHFGDSFARPAAQKAVGIVTFSRANTDAGDVTILSGTTVKTPPDANGESQSFDTILDVVLTGTSINASVQAKVAGTKGNVASGAISVIETSLTDPSVTVTNSSATSGGAAEQDDATYRETITDLIAQLRGATKDAIEATARTVAGIELATAIETVLDVKQWNVAGDVAVGDVFKIVRAKLYVADANGTANDALVAAVDTAVRAYRALGVKVDVIGATAVEVDWSATITLNPSGPNYSTLSVDASAIEDSMTAYVNALAIGEDFDRILARAAMLAIWGPSGSNDLTDFQISTPTGNISAAETEKLIPGTIEVE